MLFQIPIVRGGVIGMLSSATCKVAREHLLLLSTPLLLISGAEIVCGESVDGAGRNENNFAGLTTFGPTPMATATPTPTPPDIIAFSRFPYSFVPPTTTPTP